MGEKDWSPQQGGRQCGAVRYEITARPLTIYVCHCTECQKQSSSAFGMSLSIAKSAVRVTQGEMRTWQRRTDSGSVMTCSFCPNCGTRLFHEQISRPDETNIKPGTLDDRDWVRPMGHLWLKSAQPWMSEIVGRVHDTLKYPAQPPSKADLIARWREQHP